MISWLYSDRGTIKDYANIDGFGVNTYIWINKNGDSCYIKYHWKTLQGIKTIDRKEATLLAGEDPDIAVRNLHEHISCGDYPKYELCVQIMYEKDVEKLSFNPLDDTKTWSEKDFPLIKVGLMTLNKNPDNFFAQVEQSAFCPGNIVSGVALSADKMLQGRSFSYLDTQRHRIGPNFAQLPINRSISPVDNNQRDGNMTYTFNPEPINYSPNSLNNNYPRPPKIPQRKPLYVEGYICRMPIVKQDDFTQAGQRYHSLSKKEQEALSSNIAIELYLCKNDIIQRVINNLSRASTQWAKEVMMYMQKYSAS